ncbi:MAG: exosortase/archaeosortase family protein [Candidatus Omnitrophota bacterium]|jgi:exosortase
MINWIIWVLVAGLYSPVISQLYRARWESIDYTHAYFILPVFFAFLLFKRKQFGQGPSAEGDTSNYRTSIIALFILIVGLLMFIFGWKWDYLMITTGSMIPVLFGLVLYLYGPSTAKITAFPILYLLLLVPPPLGVLDSITMPMRYGISIATEHILKAFCIPIIRDGLMLTVGGHEVYMGAPCSGFRSLITMFSLALAYVYFINARLRNKVILVISVVPLALLGNLIRVTGMCLVTYKFGEETGHKFHDTSGLVIFVVLILGLLGIESLLEKRPKK